MALGKMSPKQRMFVDEYLQDMNARRAYKAAYPKCKSDKAASTMGYKTLNLPYVQAYIKEVMDSISSPKIASAQETLEFLTKAMRDIETEDQVVVESIGDFQSQARVITKRIPAKDRISAAITLSKYHKLLEPKHEIKEETVEKLDRIMQSLDAQAKGE